MLIIDCPWCGKRDQTEFSCHGEAHIVRPKSPENLSDQEWGDYVFFRTNAKGIHFERWVHTHGCRQWFNAARNTVTDHIYETYKPGEPRPEIKDESGVDTHKSKNNNGQDNKGENS